MPKVIVVVGPTSSGKTALAVEIARAIGGEVVSADSRQVYKGLDLGTGKATKKEMKGVRHHLLDVASPKTVFSAADFVRLGRKAIDDILTRGKVPVIAGGTGFYIDALVGRTSLPEVPPNPALRAELEALPASVLFARLQKLDPVRAESIDPHNPVRLVRALEIATALGCVLPTHPIPHYDALWLGIEVPSDVLHAKVHTRLLARLRRGMVAEARRLHAAGLSYARMDALGLEYRHLARFLQGIVDKQTMTKELESDINAYIKRQQTYWKRNTDIHWLSLSSGFEKVVSQAVILSLAHYPLRK